jgi:type I restriction enzyme M protein
LARYKVEAVIKLPRGSFHGTEALASILIFKTEAASSGPVRLYKFTPQRQLTRAVEVPADKAVERLDYDFHALRFREATSTKPQLTLATVCLDLRRGSLENSVAKTRELEVFHTTSMNSAQLGRWIHLSSQTGNAELEKTLVIATSGDILVARVGRNLTEKICGVASGNALLTDCVYRLRVHPQHRDSVLAQLSSKAGREWFESRAYGVGARQLTKIDLLSFPILLS